MKNTDTHTQQELQGWFAGRLPDDWFSGPPSVEFDREEIVVTGSLGEPDLPADATAEAKAEARLARIHRFREETRDQRIRIAREAERKFGRKVSWGADCADASRLFTTLSIPHMTRLRMRERAVLDTLVDAGVARSRSDALAWCVRLVGDNESEWIGKLRAAFEQVEKVRGEGPNPE
ncbi:MAG TPA: hypothetical protein VGH10_00225 [Actinomycetota bacterium]|jgi:hypothetical protein